MSDDRALNAKIGNGIDIATWLGQSGTDYDEVYAFRKNPHHIAQNVVRGILGLFEQEVGHAKEGLWAALAASNCSECGGLPLAQLYDLREWRIECHVCGFTLHATENEDIETVVNLWNMWGKSVSDVNLELCFYCGSQPRVRFGSEEWMVYCVRCKDQSTANHFAHLAIWEWNRLMSVESELYHVYSKGSDKAVARLTETYQRLATERMLRAYGAEECCGEMPSATTLPDENVHIIKCAKCGRELRLEGLSLLEMVDRWNRALKGMYENRPAPIVPLDTPEVRAALERFGEHMEAVMLTVQEAFSLMGAEIGNMKRVLDGTFTGFEEGDNDE